jgi:hypothetical protein
VSLPQTHLIAKPARTKADEASHARAWYSNASMDPSKPPAQPASGGSAPYAAASDGILTPEGLRQACRHVWRDSNSITMLGGDILHSEPVSCDDKRALLALRRHIAAAGSRSFTEDILPQLGFGPVRD